MSKLQKIKFSDYCAFFGAVFLPLIVFVILYQMWNFDFSHLMFKKNEDVYATTFAIKTIVHSGWYFANDMVAFPQIKEPFFLHDFPVHADFLNFALVKFFTFFSSDPFAILNIFLIATFSLNSASSFLVLKHFKIGNFIAVLVSILFAFVPYHLFRNSMHLFLSNYLVIPLVIMIALWIIEEKIVLTKKNEKGQFCFAPNKFFVIAALLCFIIASTGIYYAFYAAIIFMISYLLSSLKKGSLLTQSFLSATTLCFIIFLLLLALHIPSFIYWLENGFNQATVIRSYKDLYNFSLKIIYLFLPIENHYISYFSDINKNFNEINFEIEAQSESLGILGSSALLFSFLWLFSLAFIDNKNSLLHKTISLLHLNKKEQIFISNLSSLNLLIILFASVGGFMMFFALPLPYIRSHARFTIFIAFLAFFILAIIFNQLVKNSQHKNFTKFILTIITIFALLDQTGKVLTYYENNSKILQEEKVEKAFIAEIESKIATNSIIFELPLIGFPEGQGYQMIKGYLYSKNLRWSYPAMNGRESAIWQNNLMELNFRDFLQELKKQNFNGIYINKRVIRIMCEWNFYQDCDNNNKILQIENQLKKVAKQELISPDYQLVFFEI